MQIDWTTFALEVVNFLALVWILKRFLYRPVLDILARRRADVERSLTDAREGEARAAALRQQFEQRLAEWDKEKAAHRSEFEAELAVERERQMQVLQRALADERARHAARDAHRLAEREHELETLAVAQAGKFAATLLGRLADPALESRLLDVLIEDLKHLPTEQVTGLIAATNESGTQAIVVSAYRLGNAQRSRLTEALSSSLGPAITLVFAEDASLIAGLRVSIGPWQLKANLADELAYFAASANHVG